MRDNVCINVPTTIYSKARDGSEPCCHKVTVLRSSAASPSCKQLFASTVPAGGSVDSACPFSELKDVTDTVCGTCVYRAADCTICYAPLNDKILVT
jgi:hypothetical protein